MHFPTHSIRSKNTCTWKRCPHASFFAVFIFSLQIAQSSFRCDNSMGVASTYLIDQHQKGYFDLSMTQNVTFCERKTLHAIYHDGSELFCINYAKRSGHWETARYRLDWTIFHASTTAKSNQFQHRHHCEAQQTYNKLQILQQCETQNQHIRPELRIIIDHPFSLETLLLLI